MKTSSMVAVVGSLLFMCNCSNNNNNNDQKDGGTDAGNPPDVIGSTCNAAACPSGHCAPNGACAAGCKGDGDCNAGETCCNSTFCTNVSKDPQNCGGCGNVCGQQQFCSGTACDDALVKNVCANASATVVLDNLDVDDKAATAVGASLTASCGSVKVVTVTQGTPGTMDPGSGRPTTGPGNTYVATGGGFGQKAIAYMETTRNSPVFTIDDNQSVSFNRTSDGATIIKAPITTLTPHHDFFVVYVAAEPVSGTLVLATYGLYSAGTSAAAFWLKTQDISSLGKHYFVYQWDDTNNDGVAGPGDTFKLLESN